MEQVILEDVSHKTMTVLSLKVNTIGQLAILDNVNPGRLVMDVGFVLNSDNDFDRCKKEYTNTYHDAGLWKVQEDFLYLDDKTCAYVLILLELWVIQKGAELSSHDICAVIYDNSTTRDVVEKVREHMKDVFS